MALDPTSDKVALYYTGDDEGNPYVVNVPARDLTENDLARLLYVEHGSTLSGAAQSNALDALTSRLTAGPYRKTKPDAPAARKDTPASEPEQAPEAEQ
jgi:hypothetical protein